MICLLLGWSVARPVIVPSTREIAPFKRVCWHQAEVANTLRINKLLRGGAAAAAAAAGIGTHGGSTPAEYSFAAMPSAQPAAAATTVSAAAPASHPPADLFMGGFALGGGGGGGGGTAPMHTSPQAMLQLLCAAHCLSQPALAAS
jgi:hypothetical protein